LLIKIIIISSLTAALTTATVQNCLFIIFHILALAQVNYNTFSLLMPLQSQLRGRSREMDRKG